MRKICLLSAVFIVLCWSNKLDAQSYLMGQMALTQQITGSKQVVDISSFAGGVYIVQVVNSSGDVKNMRIVKL